MAMPAAILRPGDLASEGLVLWVALGLNSDTDNDTLKRRVP